MEIECKYKVKQLPENLERYDKKQIEQGYLCHNPIVRIRKSNDDYYITYKSKEGIDQSKHIAIVNHEVELPLTKEAYETLRNKVEHNMVYKTRYLIPAEQNFTVELDVFEGLLKGLMFAEVEFFNEEMVQNFKKPEWLGADISKDKRYSNHYLSKLSSIDEFSL